MDILTKITKARAALIHSAPFFGSLALGLKVELCSDIETADIDGVTVRFNPAYVDELSEPELTGLWAHEVMHPALGHIFRMAGRDMDQWNDACDYVVNPLVREAKLTLPQRALFDAAYEGKGAEEIYRILGEKKAEQQQQQQGAGAGQGSQPQNASSPPQNAPGGNPGNIGGMRSPPSDSGLPQPSPAEARELEQQWQMNVTQAAAIAKAAGTLPASLQRLVADMNAPKIGVEEILARFLANANPADYSWGRPNRRYVSQGLFLPSLVPDRLQRVVIVMDDSGSITDGALSFFGAIINEVLDDARPAEVVVINCDREVSNVASYGPEDFPVKLEVIGGGGTDFRPPFDYLEREGMDCDCMLYLTDLDAPRERFPAQPSFPVLWLSNGKTYAPFGEVIPLPAH